MVMNQNLNAGSAEAQNSANEWFKIGYHCAYNLMFNDGIVESMQRRAIELGKKELTLNEKFDFIMDVFELGKKELTVDEKVDFNLDVFEQQYLENKEEFKDGIRKGIIDAQTQMLLSHCNSLIHQMFENN